jgi:hypothetical protein
LDLEDCSEGLACEATRGGLAHVRAVDVFAAIHQRKERAEHAGFHLVGHREAAGSNFDERFATHRDSLNEFHLPVVAYATVRGLAANLSAFLLDEKGEVKNTQAFRSEARRQRRLAAFRTARIWHEHPRWTLFGL